MKKILLITFGMLLLAGSAIAIGYEEDRGKCSGTKSCSACKNCSGCKNCSKQGGTCGVCKK